MAENNNNKNCKDCPPGLVERFSNFVCSFPVFNNYFNNYCQQNLKLCENHNDNKLSENCTSNKFENPTRQRKDFQKLRTADTIRKDPNKINSKRLIPKTIEVSRKESRERISINGKSFGIKKIEEIDKDGNPHLEVTHFGDKEIANDLFDMADKEFEEMERFIERIKKNL